MIQAGSQIYDIQVIQAIEPCAGGSRLVFHGGLSGCVPKGHPEFERIVRYAQSSLEHGSPLGFIVNNAGEVVEVNHTHQSTVRFVNQDDEDPNRLMVGFWAYGPLCYLTKDHPEFERIRDTLRDAMRTERPVLFVNHLKMVEGENETWWKLLDVRPV
jgi:hypothetical protein